MKFSVFVGHRPVHLAPAFVQQLSPAVPGSLEHRSFPRNPLSYLDLTVGVFYGTVEVVMSGPWQKQPTWLLQPHVVAQGILKSLINEHGYCSHLLFQATFRRISGWLQKSGSTVLFIKIMSASILK